MTKSCWVAAAASQREAGIFSTVPWGSGAGLINHGEQHQVLFWILVPIPNPSLVPIPQTGIPAAEARTAPCWSSRAPGLPPPSLPRQPSSPLSQGAASSPRVSSGFLQPVPGPFTCCPFLNILPSSLAFLSYPKCPASQRPSLGAFLPLPCYFLQGLSHQPQSPGAACLLCCLFPSAEMPTA